MISSIEQARYFTFLDCERSGRLVMLTDMQFNYMESLIHDLIHANVCHSLEVWNYLLDLELYPK